MTGIGNKKESSYRLNKGRITKALAVTAVMLCLVVIAAGTRYKTVRAESGSMSPAIQTGSLSLIKKAGIEDAEIGDVVVYKTEDGNLMHRVVKINYTDEGGIESLETRGDANPIRDETVATSENIIGLVVHTWNRPELFKFDKTENMIKAAIGLLVLLLVIISVIPTKD